jgi:hypothetical protein
MIATQHQAAAAGGPSLGSIHTIQLSATVKCVYGQEFPQDFSSPAVANLDGNPDIIWALPDGSVHAIDSVTHTEVAGWPVNTGDDIASSPTVADLDGNGSPSIIVSSYSGTVNIYNPNGTERWGWPQRTLYGTGGVEPGFFSSVAVGDLYNDGQKELFATGLDQHTYAWFTSGAAVPGWPKLTYDSGLATPTLADLQHNGTMSVVTPSDTNHWGNHGVYLAWGSGGQLLWDRTFDEVPWSSPAVVDFGDGNQTIVNGTGHFYSETSDPGAGQYIVGLNPDGSNRTGFPHSTGDVTFGSPAVGDILGNNGRDVVTITEGGNLFATDGNGNNLPGYPVGIPDSVAPHTQLGGAALAPVDANSRMGIFAPYGTGVPGNTGLAVYAPTASGPGTPLLVPTPITPNSTGATTYSTPTVADLGGGTLSVIMASSALPGSCGQGNTYYLDWWAINGTSPSQMTSAAWPTFHGNFARTGNNLPAPPIATFVQDFANHSQDDIAVVRRTGTDVLTSKPGGGFNTPSVWTTTPFWGDRSTLAARLTRGNGYSLIALNSGSTWVMQNNGGTGTGTGFNPPGEWSGTPFYGNRQTLVGDVTGTGVDSLIAINDGSTWVMTSNGSSFGPPQEWIGVPFYGSKATLVADVNGDGCADMVAVNNDSTWVMLANKTGGTCSSFGSPQEWSAVPFYGSLGTMAAPVTAGNGGKASLIALNSDSIWVLPTQGTSFAGPMEWSAVPFYGSAGTIPGNITGSGNDSLVAVNWGSIWTEVASGTSFANPAEWWLGET